MDIVMRGSEYQDFLQCRKKWFYGWVEKITPKRPDNKLFFGVLFHKWLERYYANHCEPIMADLETSIWMNKQDVSGMEQTELNEQKKLFEGVRDNYLVKYQDEDQLKKILGTEVEFLVMLEDGIYFTGTIDLVYELDGKVWFADHKTVASLDMYEDKSKMDRQISRYWWALKMISQGVGRVKKEIIEDGVEKTMWVHWNELEGREIEGFVYNLIAKDYPREPKVLKSGELSKDKSQKTTYKKYIR
jgi:ATP-dependent exoDNAse (exonuclease V) beta subunit